VENEKNSEKVKFIKLNEEYTTNRELIQKLTSSQQSDIRRALAETECTSMKISRKNILLVF